MTTPQHAAPPALAPIERRFATADRRMQGEKGASLLLRSWPWLCGAILLAFAVDVALHVGAIPRLVLLGAVVLFGVAIVVTAAWIAWGRRNSMEHVARELEARDATLGSKLINLLQLHEQTTDPKVAPLTRELAGRAITGYVDDLGPVNLEGLARTDRVQREAKRTACGVAGFFLLLVLMSDITRTELARFFDPFGDHPPYSFTRIEISEPGNDHTEIIYGQGVMVRAKTAGHRPRELWLSYWPSGQPKQTTTVPMFDKGEQGFAQQIEAVKSDLIVVAHTKTKHSISKQRRIGVVLTPKLEKAWVKLTPPAYTGLPAEERALQLKSLKALTGTQLDFRLRSNRPLHRGTLEIIKSATESKRVPLTASGEMEVSGGLVATETTRLRFSLVDQDGNASQETWEVALQVTHDLAPEVAISNPSSDSFVAMDFKLEPLIEANDDYGIKTLRIHQARNGVYGEPRVIEFDKIERHARETVPLDLKTMGLNSGDTISLFGEVIDTAPEPHIARSAVVTITVISVEEYNEFLRQQTDMADIEAKFSELSNQLQDLIEEQKSLSQQSEALKKQAEKATPQEREAMAPKLDELLAKQTDVNKKLNDLANRMENFVREQPLFDVEADLKGALAEKAQQLRESTKTNDMENRILSQHGNQLDPAMTEAFQKSSDQQLSRLGETKKQLAQQVTAPLEDMAKMHELVKSFNRFKELHAAQQQLAQQAKAYDRGTPLEREDQIALKDLAAREHQIGAELEAVEKKLREDAATADEQFPKASKSARALADAMKESRLTTHASNATNAMLQARGDQSAQLSQRLLDEMNKLFSECESASQGAGNEMDSCLRLSHGLNPGNNFKQMLECKKFGTTPGQFGMGPTGQGGLSGYSVTTGPNSPVMGNETQATSSARTGGAGKDKAQPLAAQPNVSLDRDVAGRDVNAINRESGAVQGEMTVEQYRDLVEKYFKAITK